ncbi:MAG: tetratricopeptide repeat protein [Acidobacteriota bacterium]|nr:tetratricopeptide repeat protein [Acidobacteriota bacterium]
MNAGDSDAEFSSLSRDSEEDFQAKAHARVLYELGVEQLAGGQVQAALQTFDESIGSFPTAEGYTYRGWAWSYAGDLKKAIGDCMRAIRIDKCFGNPYNDIGVYLMQMGRLDEAIAWLQKAKKAERYEPKHFPYLNLGQIYLLKGEQARALDEFVRALELDPGNKIAEKAIAEMDMTDF